MFQLKAGLHQSVILYTTSPAILIRHAVPPVKTWRWSGNNNHAILEMQPRNHLKNTIAEMNNHLTAIIHNYPRKPTVIVGECYVHHAPSPPLQENGVPNLLSILSHRYLVKTWKDMTSQLLRFWYQAIVPMSCQGAYRSGLSRPKNHGGMWQGLAHWKKVALLSGVGDAAEKETIAKCRGLVRMGLRKNDDGWNPPLENCGYLSQWKYDVILHFHNESLARVGC